MKKSFLSMAFFAVICMSILASCQKSNADLIKDYENLCKEIVEATEAGNLVKVATLSDKGQKLEQELSNRNLTDEEKAQLLEIQANAATGMVSGAAKAVDDMIESTTGVTTLKGTFSGECDGLYCYLILDPIEASVETKGCLKCDSKTHEIVKVSSQPIALKCNGKFVLRQSGIDIVYNVLEVHDGDEIDPMGMVIAYEDDTNTDKLIYINILPEESGKSIQLIYVNDDDNPLFETTTLYRDKK